MKDYSNYDEFDFAEEYEKCIFKHEEELIEEAMPEKNKARAKRRHKSVAKAKRKQALAKQLYHSEWYNNLHQYSKNKIHCSCNLCRFRSVFNPDAKPIQDMKNIDAMDYQLKEFKAS